MADENIPENVDLRFLAAQQARILSELTELRVGQAALSVDLKSVKETVEDLDGRVEIIEGRLNSVDGRLARIEKHTGLVKA